MPDAFSAYELQSKFRALPLFSAEGVEAVVPLICQNPSKHNNRYRCKQPHKNLNSDRPAYAFEANRSSGRHQNKGEEY